MIDFLQVEKRHGAQVVLRPTTLRINDGERVGVVGPNGSGKSTLLELIAGAQAPDGGSIVIPRDGRIGYLRQQAAANRDATPLLDYVEQALPELQTLHGELTAIEAMLPGLEGHARQQALDRLGRLQHAYEHQGGYTLRSRAEAALCGLGFDPDGLRRPVNAFSGGWLMRAELARVLVAQPDVLMLDEPTNYLDLPTVEWLQRFLRDYPGALLLVSHDRYLLHTLTQVTVEVADGIVTRYEGDYSRYLAQREKRIEQAEAEARNLQRKRDQMERFIERFRAKNTKAAQVQSRVKALEKMDEAAPPPPSLRGRGVLRLPAPPDCGHEVIALEDIGVSYDGANWVLRHLDLRIERGEKLALVGLNGMGKTTLLRVLAGVLQPQEGRRRLGHRVEAGYLSQDYADTMPPEATVYETVRRAADETTDQRVRNLCGSLGFSGEAVDKRVAVLSGGEKIRLAFARILIRPPNLLLLDEPTTHLDIPAREMLQEALSDYAGAVCMVTHDIAFVRAVAQGILAMTPPGVTRFQGAYDDYRARIEGGTSNAQAATPRGASREEKRDRAERLRRLTQTRRQSEKEMREAEADLEKAEKERDGWLARTADPPPDLDFAEAHARLTAAQAAIDRATARWDAASAELLQAEEAFHNLSKN